MIGMPPAAEWHQTEFVLQKQHQRVLFRHPAVTQIRGALRSRSFGTSLNASLISGITQNPLNTLLFNTLHELALFESLTLSLLRFSCHPDNSSSTMFFTHETFSVLHTINLGDKK